MMDDADYLAAWRVIVAPILNHFKPTFIIVSAGFDAAYGHSPALGGYDFFIRFNQDIDSFLKNKFETTEPQISSNERLSKVY